MYALKVRRAVGWGGKGQAEVGLGNMGSCTRGRGA